MIDNDPVKINSEFGNVMRLYARSQVHAGWSVSLAEKYVFPALVCKQYTVVKDAHGNPLAYASWANLDLAAEAKYLLDPNSLDASDWKSGDRMWFIDWVSPFGRSVTTELFLYFKHNVFKDDVARSLRIKPGVDVAYIKAYGGANVSPSLRKSILFDYYLSLKSYMRDSPSKVIF